MSIRLKPDAAFRAGQRRRVAPIAHEDTANGYEAYYGLVESPFSLNPDPRFLFDSRAHSAAIGTVVETFGRRAALVVVTGEIGTGKTVLCQTVLERLPRRTFLSVNTNPVDSTQLLKQVLQDFGILSKDRGGQEPPSQHELIHTLEQFLASLIQLDAHAVIMIDEAQHLQPDVLEHVQLLSSFETGSGMPLQIVLVGRPDLLERLARPEVRQLEQRISHRCQLLPLEVAEVGDYIERRLWIARGSPEHDPAVDTARARFAPAAMAAVAVCSRGLPRVINLLCDRALEDACSRRERVVDLGAVLSAARQLNIAVPARIRLQPFRSVAAAAALLVAGTGVWMTTGAPGLSPRRGTTTAATPASAVATGDASTRPAVSAMPGSSPDEQWERAMLEQARELAKVPDVKAIQRLRVELLRRRGRAADDPPIPAAGDKAMTELISSLEVAQRLQLARDGQLLRESTAKEPR